MNLFALNIILALVWASITGAFTPGNVVAGFILGSLALWMVRNQFDTRYFSRGYELPRLILLFLYELVMSALRVALDVISPRRTFRPGIIGIPLDTKSDLQTTVLANLITLTPGTLSIDVSTDKTMLYIHAMRADDPEGLVKSIKEGFEAQIREALD